MRGLRIPMRQTLAVLMTGLLVCGSSRLAQSQTAAKSTPAAKSKAPAAKQSAAPAKPSGPGADMVDIGLAMDALQAVDQAVRQDIAGQDRIAADRLARISEADALRQLKDAGLGDRIGHGRHLVADGADRGDRGVTA